MSIIGYMHSIMVGLVGQRMEKKLERLAFPIDWKVFRSWYCRRMTELLQRRQHLLKKEIVETRLYLLPGVCHRLSAAQAEVWQSIQN